MQSIIRVNSLTKQYNHFKAVDDLSFDVMRGEVFGFLGQNGAGKSTTLRMMLGLIQPSLGEILVDGLSVAANRLQALQKMGAVIEKPDVYKYLTAEENISMFAKLSQITISKEQQHQTLQQVGLFNRRHDKVKTYSQGMKQRLGIAIALVHNPDIIILDEPTNGLDPQGITDIRNMIIYLSKELGKTVIISSHLLSEIEQIADRVLIIHKGKKVAEGTKNVLFNQANCLVEIVANNLTESITSSNAFVKTIDIKQGVWLVKMDKQLVPKLNAYLVSNGVEVLSIHQKNSLEDYFLQVTNLQ